MPKPTHTYATLSTPGTKKISVCARRVGSRDRMNVIAVCTDEGNADKIVDGLNLLQGELTKLEVPAQRVLAEVRASLAAERERYKLLDVKTRDLESQLRTKSNEIGRLTIERDRAQGEVKDLQAKILREREQQATPA
jgi:hypothetical protein